MFFSLHHRLLQLYQIISSVQILSLHSPLGRRLNFRTLQYGNSTVIHVCVLEFLNSTLLYTERQALFDGVCACVSSHWASSCVSYCPALELMDCSLAMRRDVKLILMASLGTEISECYVEKGRRGCVQIDAFVQIIPGNSYIYVSSRLCDVQRQNT